MVSVGEFCGSDADASAVFARPKSRAFTPAARDLDVGRFQVTMHDATFVRGFERFGDLSRVVEYGFKRHWTLERVAVDQFYDQVIRLDIVEMADIGMIQPSDGAGFTLEPLSELLG
jgi:hypothetical protein